METSTMDTPAIAGGTPAKTCPYGTWKRYGEEELQQLREALDQGTLFYAYGNKVKTMEQKFAGMNGVPYAIATSSGTASIHTAMMAAGISPGDEVITSPITDMGSLVPILFQGAIPVFSDLSPHGYVMTAEAVEAVVTERTKAVLAVHLWGNACELDGIQAVCKKHNLILIEDCAQAFGSTYKGRPIGTIGDMGCFSLNEFKHIACGDGGMVLTKDADLARRLRLSTDKCYSREPGVSMRNPTFLAANYRMTELQGAVACAQLDKLEWIISQRRKWCGALRERLQGVKGIAMPEATEGCDPSWWFFLMRAKEDELGCDTDRFTEALVKEGLPVGAHYIGQPCYDYPIFRDHSAFQRGSHPFSAFDYHPGLCPEAEAILKTCVLLGVKESYTDQDLEETVTAIKRVANWFCSGKGR